MTLAFSTPSPTATIPTTEHRIISSLSIPPTSCWCRPHNALDQLSQVNANTYTYDAADNVTKHADGTLQRYDVANQLCYASPSSAAAACGSTPPTDATTYAYDTRGNRTTSAPAAAGQTAYTYDQANRLTGGSLPYEPGDLGQFTALAPQRVLDTRNPATGTCYQPNNTSVSCQSTLAANTTRYFQVGGFAGSGVPAAGVNAVAFSVTAWTPGSAGNLNVFASDASTPATQLLTFPKSGTTTNGLISKLGADGRLAIRSTVATNVEVDVVGYYASSSGTRGGVYVPVTPAQLATGSLTSGSSTTIQATGNAGIPAASIPGGVGAVVVQLNVAGTTAAGFAEVWDASAARNSQTRKLSFLNADNQTTMVISKLSSSGQLSLFAGSSGFTYTVRVLGYYTAVPVASGTLNVVQTPARLLKTGSSPVGTCTPSCATLAGNAQLSVQATGAAGIPTTGVKAVSVVVTAVNVTGSAAGNVAVGNTAGTPNPTAQFAAAETISNGAIVPVDADGKIVVKNNTTANRDVIVDVVGWQEQATKTWTYTYDGDGLRTKKTAPDGTITTYTWDQHGGLPMLIAETTSGNVTRYVYGPDGLPIEDVQPSGAARYYHQDQIGSTRLLTDQIGTVIGTTNFNAYGKPTTSTGTATTPLGYAGQYTDTETGLQYLRARYYDTSSGQFLTRDPLVASTRSAYGYTAGNPLNLSDPSGLFWGEGTLSDIADTGRDAWNHTGGKVVHAVVEHSKGLGEIASVVSVVGYGSCALGFAPGCAVGSAASWASAGLYSIHAYRTCDATGIGAQCALEIENAAIAAGGAYLSGTDWAEHLVAGAHTSEITRLRNIAALNLLIAGGSEGYEQLQRFGINFFTNC